MSDSTAQISEVQLQDLMQNIQDFDDLTLSELPIADSQLLFAIIRQQNQDEEKKLLAVKKLLALGTNMNATDGDDVTALMVAIQMGSLPIVKLLAYHPSSKLALRDQRGFTALDYAIESRRTETADLLLGACVKRQCWQPLHNTNNQGHTPDRYAKSLGDVELSNQIKACRDRLSVDNRDIQQQRQIKQSASVKGSVGGGRGGGGWVSYRRSLRKAPSLGGVAGAATRRQNSSPRVPCVDENPRSQRQLEAAPSNQSQRPATSSPPAHNDRISFLGFLGSFHRARQTAGTN